jgi:hypothetical protein
LIDPVIYLSGPIAGCTDAECKDWREYVKKAAIDGRNYFGSSRYTVLDPMVRDYREFDFQENDLQTVCGIVEEDKHDIMRSDAVLVNYLPTKRCVGTVMEAIWSWDKGKLVVVNSPKGYHPSPWLHYHSHKLTWDLDDAIDYILGRFK